MGYFKVSLFKEALQYFPEWQYHWTLARSKHWGSDFFTFYPMFVISCLLVFFLIATLTGVKVYLTIVLICIC